LRSVTGVTKLNPSIFSKVCLNFFSILVGILESFLGSCQSSSCQHALSNFSCTDIRILLSVRFAISQYTITSKSTNQFKRCTYLRSLNVNQYEIVEATRLKNMASKSFSVSSPPYKISSKSTNQFKSCTTSEV
jgi:hypothetical protein